MTDIIMASNESFDTPSASKLQIEAVQTVMSFKPTDPRQSIRVFLDENPSSGIYKRCFNTLLCYNKSTSGEEEDGVPSGSLVAGWIKESLGKALSEQPLLAGRLRPKQDDQRGEMEIVSNDSGVRLIEAKFPLTLSEFLDLKQKKEAEEAELVFWEDLDKEQNPQFSPLFYVQVTNFSCGGYSIGISCSLLLNDPFDMISFLKRWTDIHIEIISRTDAPKIPIFYRPNLKKNITSSSSLPPFVSNTKPHPGHSVLFNIGSKISDSDSESLKKLAALCIDEAEQKLSQRTTPDLKVSLLVKENDVKVRNFTRDVLIQKPSAIASCSETWKDLGVDEICFQEGNRPAYVSFWINSVPDEALLILIPSLEKEDSGTKIVTTLPTL